MKIQHSKLRSIVREVVVLSVMIATILAARSSLADHYHVPSGSMQETLQIGDRVLVDKRAYGFRVPFTSMRLTSGDAVARGEIVIFDSPRDGTRLIKRIVAVAGDAVSLRSGRLSINGQSLSEGSWSNVEVFGDRTALLDLTDGGGPDIDLVVPSGMLLAIGDHRGNSADSRVFGAFPESAVYGRALAVYYRRGSGFGWRKL